MENNQRNFFLFCYGFGILATCVVWAVTLIIDRPESTIGALFAGTLFGICALIYGLVGALKNG